MRISGSASLIQAVRLLVGPQKEHALSQRTAPMLIYFLAISSGHPFHVIWIDLRPIGPFPVCAVPPKIRPRQPAWLELVERPGSRSAPFIQTGHPVNTQPITFVALPQEGMPDSLGPCRSAVRPLPATGHRRPRARHTPATVY